MPLTFPRRHRQLEADAAAVLFPAQDGEKTVTCRITRDALRAGFAAGEAGPELLDTFDRHRARIESVASRRYDLQESTSAVALTLTPADL